MTDPAEADRGRVKCVVWDLDNTLWDGVLLEPEPVVLREPVVELIRSLDQVGILHSVASKNEYDLSMAKLAEFGVQELFLAPQISWVPKSQSVATVARELNIGIDSLAFVDDQPFELAEVAHHHPEVLCVDADRILAAAHGPAFRPRFVTDESRRRRLMYRSSARRAGAEQEFTGASEDFLRTLDLRMTITPAAEEDLRRAEELTVRTNQMNSTGRTYSYEELDRMRRSSDHLVLIASLTDRFGSYGKIGLAVVETGAAHWHLRLLLVSCRVVSRGVGTVLLNQLHDLARQAGAPLRADLVETGRNRMMRIAYAFAGFRELAADGANVVLEADPDTVQASPSYMDVQVTRL